jgi:hypothetical protein
MCEMPLPPIWPDIEDDEDVGVMGDGEVEVPFGGNPVVATHMLTLGERLVDPLGVA